MGERLRQGFRRAKVALRLLECGIGGPKMKPSTTQVYQRPADPRHLLRSPHQIIAER
jgi:hypothetical protein